MADGPQHVRYAIGRTVIDGPAFPQGTHVVLRLYGEVVADRTVSEDGVAAPAGFAVRDWAGPYLDEPDEAAGEHYSVGQRLMHHSGAVWEVDAARLPGDGVTRCGVSVLAQDDYIIRCAEPLGMPVGYRAGYLMRVHHDYLHDNGWTPLPATRERRVGERIRWSSGGSIHEGLIVEVRDYGHVLADTWPTAIPPAWILDDEPTGEGSTHG
jgi:hypothetical protein